VGKVEIPSRKGAVAPVWGTGGRARGVGFLGRLLERQIRRHKKGTEKPPTQAHEQGGQAQGVWKVVNDKEEANVVTRVRG